MRIDKKNNNKIMGASCCNNQSKVADIKYTKDTLEISHKRLKNDDLIIESSDKNKFMDKKSKMNNKNINESKPLPEDYKQNNLHSPIIYQCDVIEDDDYEINEDSKINNNERKVNHYANVKPRYMDYEKHNKDLINFTTSIPTNLANRTKKRKEIPNLTKTPYSKSEDKNLNIILNKNMNKRNSHQ